LEQQLVKDLEVMRDTLTTLSLALHDLQFMVEQTGRDAAGELAALHIGRIQSGPH
jgi:hypothetical protein